VDLRVALNELTRLAAANGIELRMEPKLVGASRSSSRTVWHWRLAPDAAPQNALLVVRLDEDCSPFEDFLEVSAPVPTRGPEPAIVLVWHHDVGVTESQRGRRVSLAAIARFIISHGPDSLRLRQERFARLTEARLEIEAKTAQEFEANALRAEECTCTCGGLNDNCVFCGGRGYFKRDGNGQVRW